MDTNTPSVVADLIARSNRLGSNRKNTNFAGGKLESSVE